MLHPPTTTSPKCNRHLKKEKGLHKNENSLLKGTKTLDYLRILRRTQHLKPLINLWKSRNPKEVLRLVQKLVPKEVF